MLLKIQDVFSFRRVLSSTLKGLPIWFLFCFLISSSQVAAMDAREEGARIPKLSISLFTSEVKTFEDALTESAKALVQATQTQDRYLQRFDILDKRGCIFIEIEKLTAPVWADVLQQHLQDSGQDTVTLGKAKRQKSGLILIQESGRIFAFTFGDGRYLIQSGNREPRFGLRVVFNTVAYNEAQDETVAPAVVKDCGLNVLGVNPVYRFASYSKGPRLQDIRPAEGSTALKSLTVPDCASGKKIAFSGPNLVWPFGLSSKEVSELPGLCTKLMSLFLKDDYKRKYAWVERVLPITEPKLKEALNGLLIAEINTQKSRKWSFVVPDDIDEAHLVDFLFQDKAFDDLDKVFESVHSYIETKNKKKIEIKLNYFKTNKICCRNEQQKEINSYSIYQCLAFEIMHQDRYYVLNSGEWLEVGKGFIKEINDFINPLQPDRGALERISSLNCLKPLTGHEQKEAKGKKGIDYLETTYNRRVTAESAGQLLFMDRRNITMGVPGHDTMEVCDLLGQDRHLIHVKNWSGSSTFSHLCAQGLVSALTLKGSEDARRQAKELYVQGEKKEHPESREEELGARFESILPSAGPFNASDYTIVYAFFHPKREGLLSEYLPFFSRLSLKETAANLISKGFKVAVLPILKLPIPGPIEAFLVPSESLAAAAASAIAPSYPASDMFVTSDEDEGKSCRHKRKRSSDEGEGESSGSESVSRAPQPIVGEDDLGSPKSKKKCKGKGKAAASPRSSTPVVSQEDETDEDMAMAIADSMRVTPQDGAGTSASASERESEGIL